jgi:atypical dual specificity phosphatase
MALHAFSWVIPGELAGMARPDGTPDDVKALTSHGVGGLVNLTPWQWPAGLLQEGGLDYLHLAIPDFAPPEPGQVDAFVEFCDRHIQEGRAVAAHCLAGRGRTGTMAACYLVSRGMPPAQAVRRIRALRPGSIETWEQEQAVYEFAARRGAQPD